MIRQGRTQAFRPRMTRRLGWRLGGSRTCQSRLCESVLQLRQWRETPSSDEQQIRREAEQVLPDGLEMRPPPLRLLADCEQVAEAALVRCALENPAGAGG